MNHCLLDILNDLNVFPTTSSFTRLAMSAIYTYMDLPPTTTLPSDK